MQKSDAALRSSSDLPLPRRILKFGGTSVANAECIQRVVNIVLDARKEGEVAVVVSALGGVTDALIDAARTAERGDLEYRTALAVLSERHHETLIALANPKELDSEQTTLTSAISDLHDLLHGTFLLREASPRTLDAVSSYGERLSSRIVAAALRNAGTAAQACDARHLLVTDRQFGRAQVDLDTSRKQVREHFGANTGAIQVVTGFIAATPTGETTTLGRGGSDFTAALLGELLEVEKIELWTDVDGVLSADPRQVEGTKPLAHLSYDELAELSHFGAKVVYPPSVHPARRAGIELWIKNTFRPEVVGTCVSLSADTDDTRPVCGVASIPNIALLRLEGDGMIGIPGIAMRLFGALERHNVSVILITQASSEYSICFAIAPQDIDASVEAVNGEFSAERIAGLIEPLAVEKDLSIVAAVGEGMRHRAGIAGRIFSVLGERAVNVRAIAQGSSERNISLVVSVEETKRAVNALHAAFQVPRPRRIEIHLAGVGQVGSAFLAQLAARREALFAERGLDLHLTAVAGSRQHLVEVDGMDPATAVERLRAEDQADDPKQALADWIERLTEGRRSVRRIFVDCTASADVTAALDPMIAAGARIVSANKLRFAGPLDSYDHMMDAAAGRIFWETTAGAALPVISTLREMVATGDTIERIEGVLSGTLAFLADRLAAGLSFSEAVIKANELGYTEPDPREDLGGNDAARKLLILGRLSGWRLAHDAVEIVPILPDPSWYELDLDTFWQRLPELDEHFAKLQSDAEAAGKRLCCVGSVTAEGAYLELAAIGSEHPCFSLRGTDNLVAIKSARYGSPLVVRGAGAGPEITASGVFGDVLKAASMI